MPRPLLRRVRNRIATVRQARGWSQAELALRLGVSRGALAGWVAAGGRHTLYYN